MVQHVKWTNVIYHINRVKGKTHIIILIDAEKAFEKIQHNEYSMIKTLNELWLEGNYLNIIKAIYEKYKADVILNGEKLKTKLLLLFYTTKFWVICYIIIYNQNRVNKLKIHPRAYYSTWHEVEIQATCFPQWLQCLNPCKFLKTDDVVSFIFCFSIKYND